MQRLGLSDSTPQSESRIKSLFWPSIQNGSDVDYLGAQGYWVCTLVAVLSFGASLLVSNWINAVAILIFYYVGGVGVRERSRYAALVVFLMFAADMVAGGPGVFRILIGALLLSNVRATWIAFDWKPESEEAALPPRFSDTLGDKFADQFPAFLWPKIRIVYYIYSAILLGLVFVGIVTMLQHRHVA
jgi:hypothetical protein